MSNYQKIWSDESLALEIRTEAFASQIDEELKELLLNPEGIKVPYSDESFSPSWLQEIFDYEIRKQWDI